MREGNYVLPQRITGMNLSVFASVSLCSVFLTLSFFISFLIVVSRYAVDPSSFYFLLSRILPLHLFCFLVILILRCWNTVCLFASLRHSFLFSSFCFYIMQVVPLFFSFLHFYLYHFACFSYLFILRFWNAVCLFTSLGHSSLSFSFCFYVMQVLPRFFLYLYLRHFACFSFLLILRYWCAVCLFASLDHYFSFFFPFWFCVMQVLPFFPFCIFIYAILQLLFIFFFYSWIFILDIYFFYSANVIRCFPFAILIHRKKKKNK